MILITGCAGFIGFHTCNHFLDKGFNVLGVDNLNNYYDVRLKLSRLKNLGILEIKRKNDIISGKKNFKFVKADISKNFFWNLIENLKVDSVIHLAAQAGVRYSLKEPLKYLNSNIIGFQNVLDYCVSNKINNFIYASSSSVYGKSAESPFRESFNCTNPESLYAATKITNELMANVYYKTKKLNSVGLRFFTVYGPWGRPDMAPMIFLKAALNNKPINVFNFGNQMRDFTFIDDIVNGIYSVFSMKKMLGHEVFNIGKGEPIHLKEFIRLIEKSTENKITCKYVEAQPGDVEKTFSSTEKLKKRTGYNPKIDIEEGIKIFVKWYKTYYKYN